MDNQHKMITGYRDLRKEEIDLINKFKADEAEILKAIFEFEGRVTVPGDYTVPGSFNPRSLAIARTKFQEAYMWLIRAVARPNGE